MSSALCSVTLSLDLPNFDENHLPKLSENWVPKLWKCAPLQDTLDFNDQVFAEDKAIVEEQYPEDLPLRLQDEVHIAGDKSSITYRKGLSALGSGRSFTA